MGIANFETEFGFKDDYDRWLDEIDFYNFYEVYDAWCEEQIKIAKELKENEVHVKHLADYYLKNGLQFEV